MIKILFEFNMMKDILDVLDEKNNLLLIDNFFYWVSKEMILKIALKSENKYFIPYAIYKTVYFNYRETISQ